MDSSIKKMVSALLALAICFSSFGVLATQLSVSEKQSSHCQGLDLDFPATHKESSQQAPCSMGDCAKDCDASRHCSSQVSVIPVLPETANSYTGKSVVAHPGQVTRFSIHLPGPYRPPRA